MDPSIIVNLIVGFIGVFGTAAGTVITLRHTAKQEERRRQLSRKEKAIDEFLAPVLALRNQAEHLEGIISITLDAAAEKSKNDPGADDFDLYKSIHFYHGGNTERWERCYEDIHALVRDKGYLAEEVTRDDYRKLLELVEFLRWRKNEHYDSAAVTPIAPDRQQLNDFFAKIEAGLIARQEMLDPGKLPKRAESTSRITRIIRKVNQTEDLTSSPLV